MLCVLCALAVGQPLAIQEPQALKATIESAAMFQPGLVYLVRRAEVPAGKGRYRISVVPEAVDGSFWYSCAEGTVSGALTRIKFVTLKEKVPLLTPAQLIAGNVGKRVKFSIPVANGKLERVQGTIEFAGPPPSRNAGLRMPDGSLRNFDIFQANNLDTKGLSTSVEVETKVPERIIEFDIETPRTTQLRMVSLERGATWAGSYAVDVGDLDAAKLTFKVQLALGGMKLEGTDVRLQSGMPKLPSSKAYDLASGVNGMQAYVDRSSRTGNWVMSAVDPFEAADFLLRERARVLAEKGFEFYASQGSGGYGGFGGGGSYERGSVYAGIVPGSFARAGEPGSGIDFISYDPTDNSIIVRKDKGQGFEFGSAAGEMLDLFSYALGKLNMEPGDRLTKVLFEGSARTHSVVKWELRTPGRAYSSSDTIGRYIEVENASPFPWAPGTCMVLKRGVPMALSDMPFTAKGETALVSIAGASDIPHEQVAKELSRVEIQRNPYVARAKMQETLTIRNPRSEAVDFHVVRDFTGQLETAEGATVATLDPRSAPDPLMRLEWKFSLKPGEERKLVFVYQAQTP